MALAIDSPEFRAMPETIQAPANVRSGDPSPVGAGQPSVDSLGATSNPIGGVIMLAVAFWLLAWVVKIHFFLPYFGWVCREYPLEFAFFPQLAASAWVSLLAYLLPLVAGTLALRSSSRRTWQFAALTLTTGAGVLCVHLNSYNDATFVTSFWSGLWLLWLTTRDPRRSQSIALHGPLLAQGVISLMFLGGAVGKLTPEYWNGTALYHIYFLQKDNFIYPWVRTTLDETTLRSLATVFSRAVIFAEFGIALLVFRPSRGTLLLSAGTMVGIAVISTSFLFSVMGSLIGIALAAARLCPGSPCGQTRQLPTAITTAHTS